MTQVKQTYREVNLKIAWWTTKWYILFDELRFIRYEQVHCSRGMVHFHQNMGEMNEKIGEVVQVTNSQLTFMKTLAYRSIDLEARSWRNNLIFRGFVENVCENCLHLLQDFPRNRLGLGSTNWSCQHIISKHSPSSHCHLSMNQVSFQSLLYFPRYGPDRQHWKMVKGW